MLLLLHNDATRVTQLQAAPISSLQWVARGAFHYEILNRHLQDLITDLDLSMGSFFTHEELDQLAREAGFVQRKSKLSGSLFLDLIVFHSENLKSQSLNDLSVLLNRTG